MYHVPMVPREKWIFQKKMDILMWRIDDSKTSQTTEHSTKE